MSSFSRVMMLCLLAPAVIACTAAPSATPPTASPTPPARPSPTPTAPPSVAPTAAPSPSVPAGPVIATFDVVGEEYRILLTDPDDIAIAYRLLSGEEAPSIPNGLIVRGETSVNTGWSWHIDPESVEFADMTMEICDGLPSHVEDGTLAIDRYCPWLATVVAVEPAS